MSLVRGFVQSQWPGMPGFDVLISFLIEITDAARRYLGSPERFDNILHSVDGNIRQIHFDKRFLNRGFSATIPPDNGRFKFWHLQFNVASGCLKMSFVMTGRYPFRPEECSYFGALTRSCTSLSSSAFKVSLTPLRTRSYKSCFINSSFNCIMLSDMVS